MLLENNLKKGEIAQNEQFHLFPQCFLCSLILKSALIATFQLSSAASIDLGRSQNGVIENGSKKLLLSRSFRIYEPCRRQQRASYAAPAT